jgi:hypothetical protein
METSQINDAPGNEEEEEEEVEMSGEFVVHRAPIRPSSINDTLDEEDDDEDAEEEDGEETIDMSGQFILHRAPIHPYRFGDVHDGNSMFGFGDLDRAIEPERSTRASSEASTIPLDYSTTRPRAPFPAPSHALSIASLPLKSALPPSLQEWRYRDATLPDTLPRTIGQWAKLEHKVRMITPLPNAEKPERVSEVTIREVRRRYDEMWVRDQKRVCEVVRKSWVEGEDVVVSPSLFAV